MLTACRRVDVQERAPRPELPPAAVLPPVPPAPPGSQYPLLLEAGRRYLVDASGRPFMIFGDTAWSILVQLTAPEVEAYLNDRHSRGYNAILVNLLEIHFSDDPPRNREGVAPFTVPGSFASPGDYLRQVDYSQPDERYFARFDHLLSKAADNDILVLVVPSYAGYLGEEQGWWSAMKRNGAAKMRQYGRFLGHRYRGCRNLMWVHGGDYDVPDKALVREMAEGIREYDHQNLHSFHGGRGTGALDWMAGEGWLSVGNIYTGEVVYQAAQKHYAERPGVPFFLIEAYYEGAKPDPRLTRLQAYQALLSGASGQLSGHDPIWQFKPEWQQALDGTTSRSMTHLIALFRGLPWWKLRPDLDRTLLVDVPQSGVERAVAASAEDGSFALLYTPSVREMRVDTTRLAGPRVAARWLDPVSGSVYPVEGAPAVPSAAHTYKPTGSNAVGLGDWVLVLESVR